MSFVQQELFEHDVQSSDRPVNVASVPQRSPFRYPGGKTWFVPRLREWLRSRPKKPKRLIEPFAGGGIISLTAAFEGLVDSVLMIELDDQVASVWETIFSGEGEWLANRIRKFAASRESIVHELSIPSKTRRDKAFQTILKNRVCHGGILAAGSGFLKYGEAGKGILSRWYPETLARRINAMNVILSRMTFQQKDAFTVLKEFRGELETVYFIDPPYTVGGKRAGARLYTHFQMDHDLLFQECCALAGDFIMTYDHTDEVRELARKYGLQAKPIAMKNTHHAEMTELVIGRDLSWMSNSTRTSR